MTRPPRIGVAGFLHESNTFLGVPTTYHHFTGSQPRTLLRQPQAQRAGF